MAHSFNRRLSLHVSRVFIYAVVGAALFVILLRLAGSQVPAYVSQLEGILGARLGASTHIGSARVDWRDGMPLITVQDVTLIGLDKQSPVYVERVGLHVDIWRSIWARALRTREVHFDGLRLTAMQDALGAWRLLQPKNGGTTDISMAAILRAIPAPEGISISRLDLQVETPASRYDLHDVSVAIGRVESENRIHVDIPSLASGRAEIRVAWKGDYEDLLSKRVMAYVRAERFDMQWLSVLSVAKGVAPSIEMDGEAWLVFHRGALADVQSRVTIASSPHPLLSRWQVKAGGWALTLYQNDPVANQHPAGWLALTSDATAEAIQRLTAKEWDLAGLPMDIVRLASGVELPDSAYGKINAMQALRFPAAKNPAWALDVDFSELGWPRFGNIPGLRGWSGSARGNVAAGEIQLHDSALQIDFGNLFRAPLYADHALAVGRWNSSDVGLQLDIPNLDWTSADLHAVARCRVFLPTGGREPLLDVRAHYVDANGIQTPSYIPRSIMPEAAVQWLDQAFVAVRSDIGDVIFYGWPSQYPFEQAAGIFEVTGEFSKGQLHYHPAWPDLHDMQGRLRFFGRSMEIVGDRGTLFGTKLTDVRAIIPKLNEPVLDLSGKAFGATADMLRFVRETPLHATLGPRLDTVRGGGNNGLELHVSLPLDDNGNGLVDGAIKFAQGQLALAATPLVLDQLTGDVRFDSTGISAPDLKATVLGQPVALTLRTEAQENHQAFIFDAKTHVTPHQLPEPLLSLATPYASGAADWGVEVTVPNDVAMATRVAVTSDLLGLALHLPSPFKKTADTTLPIAIRTEMADKGPQAWHVQLGDIGQAVVEVEGQALKRGDIRLANGQANLPPNPGLQISGNIDKFSLSEWQALLGNANSNSSPPAVDVKMGNFEAIGSEWKNVHIRSAAIAAGREITVRGEGIDGRIAIPDRPISTNPVMARFATLHLLPTEAPTPEGPASSLRSVPAARFVCEDCKYRDAQLGHVEFDVTPVGGSVNVAPIKIRSPQVQMDGDLTWRIAQRDETETQLHLDLTSADAGRALTALGYVGAIEGGPTKARLDLRWPGSPAAVSSASIAGEIGFNLGKGRLLRVEPGRTGRAFGLLSVQALPRRLTLDFTDLFGKGFGFDYMEALYDVADGNATTRSFIMQGSTGRITVDGRIGLVAKDYDQQVAVAPDLSASVSLAGVWAAGPQVGVALLLAQQLWRPHFSVYRYRVKGRWDDPLVVPDQASAQK